MPYSLIIICAIYENQAWPRTVELQLDSLTEVYSYGSTPEAGMPPLPFKDNSVRKSSEQPFFEFPYYENDELGEQQVAYPEELADDRIESGETSRPALTR